jgi:precorrin-6A synthase
MVTRPGVLARRLAVIGVGAGDPSLVTAQAVEALRSVDVFILIDKGETKADLVAVRTAILRRFVPEGGYRVVEMADPTRDPNLPYTDGVRAWYGQRLEQLERLLIDEVGDGQLAGILVWGDPSLYDNTLRLVDGIGGRGAVRLEVEVIPGISSVALLAARHRLVLNRVGGSVHITSGRALATGVADHQDDIVVMLDAGNSFSRFADLPFDIYWGAYLGTPDEVLRAGPVAEVGPEIVRLREEARARKGWIFDIYLLRRRLPG